MARPTRIDRRSGWQRLQPERVLPPQERLPVHALELVSAYKGSGRGFWQGFGHAWIRLLSPDGAVRSVGYFPDESMNLAPERQPGLRMPGMLLHPDKYDGQGQDPLITRIALDAPRFDALVDWLERLQAGRQQGSLPFSLIDLNCVWLVVAAAERVGVRVEAQYSVLEALQADGPAFLRPLWAVLGRCATPRRWAFNLALSCLGGYRVANRQWVVDGQGRRRQWQIDGLQPMFGSVGATLQARVPFLHVRALRLWQLRQPAAAQQG
ncbi:hypothetical protein [Pseudorhodoferax sp.]|uniref:hypothetical protein n=1 Tax=Pseudorhodoferax sp. TaxID=1993553 RepID=UPI002DD67D41|nr:hypothetical protein [Pseudorhodoferax sp.]